MREEIPPIKEQSGLVKLWHILPYLLIVTISASITLLIIANYNNITHGVNGFVSKNMNLKVKHIYISGIENAKIKDINNAIQIQRGDSLFSVDPNYIRENVENLPWVRLAQVQRIFPDTIKINVFEHKPIAIIKFDSKTWTLNNKGDLIDTVGNEFDHLLELSGNGAKDNAAVFFSLFSNWTDLIFELKQAEFIGKRRWDLYLNNGAVVMLPEENMRYALEILKVLNNQQNILGKKQIKIDLRNIPQRIIINENPNLI